MRLLFVVDQPRDWPLSTTGVEVIGARTYVTDPAWMDVRGARVFNLCRSYAYQSVGYYVSLLAEARGHRPSPTLGTIQDARSRHRVRAASDHLEDLIERSLATLESEEFTRPSSWIRRSRTRPGTSALWRASSHRPDAASSPDASAARTRAASPSSTACSCARPRRSTTTPTGSPNAPRPKASS